MSWVYPVGNAMIRRALKTFANYRVEGLEAVPPKGPLLVVSNHLSNMDPPLLGVSIPRRLHYLAKRGLFRTPLMRYILYGYGAFPINRDSRDIRGYEWTLKVLKQEQALVLFPDGTRSTEGLRKPILGMASLHLKTRAPILPVAITGTEHLGHLLRVFFPTGNITVRIGQPFTLPLIEGRVSRAQLEAMADMIMERVAALLPPRYRGVYRGTGGSPPSPDGERSEEIPS